MIQIPEILVANGTGMVLMTIVIRHFSRNSRSRLLSDRLFLLMAHLAGGLCLLEAAAFLADGRQFPLAIPVSYLLNMLLFICSIVFTYTWVLYADSKLPGSPHARAKFALLAGMPALLCLALVVTTPLTHLIFSISPDNVYSRGRFVPLIYVCTYGYLVWGGVHVYLRRDRADRYVNIPISTFLLPILAGSSIQFFFYGLATQWLSICVGMISLYVNMQSESMHVDSLSGLYNRLYLDRFLAYECQRTDKQLRLVGVMIDIDHFKQINDQYGHLKGDRAIEAVGSLLRRSIQGLNAFAARYGGDEFMILAQFEHESEAQALIRRVNEQAAAFNAAGTEPFQLEFSIGMTALQPGKDSMDDFLTRMDQQMYAIKHNKPRA